MSAIQLKERTNNQINGGDADLLLRLRIALSTKKRAGWHLVNFAVQDGAVKLVGVVPSFYDRQLIASLVRHVAGVLRIDDQLAVSELSPRQQGADFEGKNAENESNTHSAAPENAFSQLPVLPHSLDDIVPVHAGVVLPAA